MKRLIALSVAGVVLGVAALSAQAATVIGRDDFTGTSSSLGTADVGGTWSQNHGSWSRAADKAKPPQSDGSSQAFLSLGVSTGIEVSADITMSPVRTNAGLLLNYSSGSNHAWMKVEISPGHPNGFMSIGDVVSGRNRSLRAAGSVSLKRGVTYHVTFSRTGNVYKATVGQGGSVARTLTWNAAGASGNPLGAYGSATRHGMRYKKLFDEDDGQTRFDNFLATTLP
jgi:hypothetical protein